MLAYSVNNQVFTSSLSGDSVRLLFTTTSNVTSLFYNYQDGTDVVPESYLSVAAITSIEEVYFYYEKSGLQGTEEKILDVLAQRLYSPIYCIIDQSDIKRFVVVYENCSCYNNLDNTNIIDRYYEDVVNAKGSLIERLTLYLDHPHIKVNDNRWIEVNENSAYAISTRSVIGSDSEAGYVYTLKNNGDLYSYDNFGEIKIFISNNVLKVSPSNLFHNYIIFLTREGELYRLKTPIDPSDQADNKPVLIATEVINFHLADQEENYTYTLCYITNDELIYIYRGEVHKYPVIVGMRLPTTSLYDLSLHRATAKRAR
jgi:hypothetical protein